jgi:hypothetical protein
MHNIGEWSVDGHNMAAVIRKTATGWETVSICPNGNATWRQDARLQASAPEMLSVLQEALEFFEDRSEGEYFTDRAAPVGNAESRLASAIREVLSKAGALK